jgi:5-bromo-4-chloroindolyl phosphate hydrolysis protein
MKRGAALIVVFGVFMIALGFYYFYSANEYASAVDARVEREIADADLGIIREELNEAANPTSRLRELYQGAMYEELNHRYARLLAGWLQAYPRLERIPMIHDQLDSTQRLALEVDERMGPGTFAIMQDEYARYQAELPARLAQQRALQEQAQAEAERVNRYIEDYMRRYGRFPDEIPVTAP